MIRVIPASIETWLYPGILRLVSLAVTVKIIGCSEAVSSIHPEPVS